MRAQRLFLMLARHRLPAGGAVAVIAGCLLFVTLRPGAAAVASPGVATGRLPANVSARGLRPGVAGQQAMAGGPLTILSASPTPIPTPTPTVPPPRTEVITYQVQPGDNLWLIAERFGLAQDTVVWANPELERNLDLLRIGQELKILPVDGVLHKVVAGETLDAIAARYRVECAAIADYAPNGLGGDGSAIKAGQQLIVPGGRRPPPSAPAATQATISGGRLVVPAGAPAVPVDAPAQPGRFVWPAQGFLSQGYGRYHGAIDIAKSPQGSPILAADAGTIAFAGWSGGLGNAIQIDHGDGFTTTYGHLMSIGVQVGQTVQQGEQIGRMGTTGHSTGPHLHFIVTYQGGIVNPLDYLP